MASESNSRKGNNPVLKKILFIILLVFIFQAAFSANWKEIIQQFGSNVGLIEILNNDSVKTSGSGFIFTESGNILTNAHVVKDAYFNDKYEIRIKFELKNPNEYHKAKILHYSRELDLAVLSSDLESLTPCVLGDSENLELMDDIMILGYPLGKSVKATPGNIQAFQNIDSMGNMIDLSSDVDPGNSGGPVFNDSGEVIGIVTAKIFGYNFNLALPIKLVQNYLVSLESNNKIQIISQPESCRIFVNNQYKGLSPLELDYFGIQQKIQIEKDGFITQNIIIDENNLEDGKIEIILEKKPKTTSLLKITTTPKGALVFLDNEQIGTSPLEFEVNKNSSYRIRIIKTFYKEFYKEIKIGNEDNYSFDFKL